MPDNPAVSSEAIFDAMRLHPGAAMQIRSSSDGAATHTVKFIGAIKGKSVLTTLPVVNGKGVWMQAGHTYVIRGFTGMYAYAFESQVIMARAHPFAYVHFAYPRAVTSKIVRKSLRVKASLPAEVTPRSAKQPVSVSLMDLSATGSMVDSRVPVGEIGDVVGLAFAVAFDNITANLSLSAIIRSVQKPENGESLRTGLEFENVARNDQLILRSFVHSIETASPPASA